MFWGAGAAGAVGLFLSSIPIFKVRSVGVATRTPSSISDLPLFLMLISLFMLGLARHPAQGPHHQPLLQG